ncbi:MAG TPA: hypothetical protein PLG24_06685, partial [Saprospiraceae bacterium]|nr:hypothetical protein [Saprospiraceae bacterium]
MKICVFLLQFFFIFLSFSIQVNAQFDKLKKSATESYKTISNSNIGKEISNRSKNTTAPEKQDNKNTSSNQSSVTNYYIRPDGRGKDGTKENPAKDIAAIAMQLKPGDVVHVAAGVYKSKADQSSDVFAVPISIIGGYSPDFSKRDPWGQYQTVFSGTNDISKGLTTERIGILTDKGY